MLPDRENQNETLGWLGLLCQPSSMAQAEMGVAVKLEIEGVV